MLLDELPGGTRPQDAKGYADRTKGDAQKARYHLYLCHSRSEEALILSDTVVVMNEGKIQQIGTPTDIYNEPENCFVADFIGEPNILNGKMFSDRKVGLFTMISTV